MNDDCERMKDKMADLLFDGLDEQDTDALNEHIDRCPKCAEYLQRLRDENALLRQFAQKVGAGMQRRKEAMAEAIGRCNPGGRSAILGPLTKLAAAALVFIVIGFVAGRLMPARQADIEQLQAALETSLKASIEKGIQGSLIERVNLDREAALERHYVRLKDEFARQSRREMSELAEMTLAASGAATEERLAELIRLIETVRTVDHWQIARALEQVETNRIEDRIRFGESLVSLASLNNAMRADDPERN